MELQWPDILLIGLGWPEMLVVILIIVILFGARRIPEVAKGLGEGIRSFKTGLHGDDRKGIEDNRKSEPEVAERKEQDRKSA